jgi:Nitrogenase molybdenum-iron protein, alpha and beta chains
MSTFPIVQQKSAAPPFTATRNACKLCAPLGAALVIRGVEGALPYLHGSQGCATYMRRYIISHFREPMDIAASNFSEASTVFGGSDTFRQGITNVQSQYRPELIGIATTCLTETIGEDLSLLLSNYGAGSDEHGPALVPVSTPSYRGTHIDGFHAAVLALVEKLAHSSNSLGTHINLFPGMVSPADLRHLKEIVTDFEMQAVLLPDYSDTLDGVAADVYHKIPAGGTPLAAIRSTADAIGTIEFGRTIFNRTTAASHLEQKFKVPAHRMGMPIGVRETDVFFQVLEQLSGVETPRKHSDERGRLIDAYVDGHKYVYGARAVIFGEEDLVVGLASFLAEIGVEPVLCGSGGVSGNLAASLAAVAPQFAASMLICDDTDFLSMEERARDLKPDFLIGSSKGQLMARHLDVPLIRVGFPVHDRIGGQRILHLGYRGAQQLFDRVVNTLLDRKQQNSPIGYSYM